jgi:hypothetical protein
MNIIIERIPINNILQFKYFSNNIEDITFEKLQYNTNNERYRNIGLELANNPQNLFN